MPKLVATINLNINYNSNLIVNYAGKRKVCININSILSSCISMRVYNSSFKIKSILR